MENNIIQLPKFKVENVISSLSQVVDWGVKDTNVPKAWHVTQGEGEVAFVIDTGHPTHTDIGSNAIKGKNCIKGEGIVDLNGHHTHVAGIICAKHNSQGMVGVAPKAKTVSVKALNANGTGSYYAIRDSLRYCLEAAEGKHEYKPSVVSMSLGAPQDLGSEVHDIIKKLTALNVPVIVAAGNSGNAGVDYPGKYPETITVAAYDRQGNIANFSAVGEEVDWAAPGVNIYSTWLRNRYAKLNGTSMATPWMTGIVLLLLAKHKKQEKLTGKNDCKTVEQIREHLLKYTDDKGALGRDEHFGYGVIRPDDLILEGQNVSDEPVYPDPVDDKPEPVEDPYRRKTLWERFLSFFQKIFS